jgi:aspartate ammonia-lyase
MPRPAFRVESDLLGKVRVPATALYGAQTQRAVLNFPRGGWKSVGDYPEMVDALMAIKSAAAIANRRMGAISPERAAAVLRAARRVTRERRYGEFPIHALHGGGGTSANMNANEVLANLAEESLGGRRGQYRQVHPNDHVNLHQSTNDVYPTACHLAVVLRWPGLRAALTGLAETFASRAGELRRSRRLARTCLQDAVDTTYGDLLGGYEAFTRRALARVDSAVAALHAVCLGGTIVGRACDTPAAYRAAVIPALRQVTGDRRWRRAPDLFDAAQNIDDLAHVVAQLDLTARGLIKIAQDFRLLASGPEGGLGELRLPPMQPGSSIMPGKVNPVIPEFLIQAGFQTIGANAACLAAVDHGELDLNVWESTVVFNILDALELLAAAVAQFDRACVRGFTVDAAVNARHIASIIPLLTRLMRRHGYSRVSDACKTAPGDPDRIRAELKARGLRE